MATTTRDRTAATDRPAGAPPAPGRRRKGFGEAVRDAYVERKDGPVTMRERRRATVSTLIAVPALVGIVAAVQTWGRDREVEASWFVSGAVATVVLAAVGFAVPRVSLGGTAHRRTFDRSKESVGSKIVAIVAGLLFLAIVVARAVWRLDD